MTTSSGQQTTQQQSQTQPWAPAIPQLQNILSNVGNLQQQSQVTPWQQGQITNLVNNANQIPNLSPLYSAQAQSFASGDPFNILNPAYQKYQNQLAPITNPANLNPNNTPGFSQALNTLNTDITNQINGEFAAAGRSGSGYNDQTLARGLAQGEGGLIQGQYNQNVQDLINAGSQMFGAGINTNSALSNNVGNGISIGGALPGLATQGPGTVLNASQTPFNLAAGNQGILSNLTVPIAGLGGQQFGTSNTQVSQTPSLYSDILGGFKSFFPYGFQGGGR